MTNTRQTTDILVDWLEFYIDKENGLGMSIKDAIARAETDSAAGETPWKNALTIVFGRGN